MENRVLQAVGYHIMENRVQLLTIQRMSYLRKQVSSLLFESKPTASDLLKKSDYVIARSETTKQSHIKRDCHVTLKGGFFAMTGIKFYQPTVRRWRMRCH